MGIKPVGCPCQGNLLVNPGFENMLLSPWTVTGLGTVVVEDRTQFVHSGLQSARFDLQQGNATLSQTVEADQNCCYDLMFWAQGASGTQRSLTATLEFLNNLDQVLQTETIFVDGQSFGSSWISYRLVTGPAPAGTTRIRVSFAVVGTGAQVLWLDDVILSVNGTGAIT